jgi:hypothetical protein
LEINWYVSDTRSVIVRLRKQTIIIDASGRNHLKLQADRRLASGAGWQHHGGIYGLSERRGKGVHKELPPDNGGFTLESSQIDTDNPNNYSNLKSPHPFHSAKSFSHCTDLKAALNSAHYTRVSHAGRDVYAHQRGLTCS